MAPSDKPRNNARKAAARAIQRANPGMSYLDALAQVASTPQDRPGLPLLSTLLGITTVDDVRARYARPDLDLTVPVGINAAGEQVSMNFDAVHTAPDALGPHGVIVGPNALKFALTVVTALRATNGPTQLQVALVGSVPDCNAVTLPVDHTILRSGTREASAGPAPADTANDLAAASWPQWIAAELKRRAELARDAGVHDVRKLDDVPPRLVLLVVDDGTQSEDETAALVDTVRCGRSSGVHVILVRTTPADKPIKDATALIANMAFLITSGRSDGDPVVTLRFKKTVTTFRPATLGDGALAQWIGAARGQ